MTAVETIKVGDVFTGYTNVVIQVVDITPGQFTLKLYTQNSGWIAEQLDVEWSDIGFCRGIAQGRYKRVLLEGVQR